ncbi:MAG: hypothetical protein AAF532_03615 [Planctomycetota bacterium]
MAADPTIEDAERYAELRDSIAARKQAFADEIAADEAEFKALNAALQLFVAAAKNKSRRIGRFVLGLKGKAKRVAWSTELQTRDPELHAKIKNELTGRKTFELSFEEHDDLMAAEAA